MRSIRYICTGNPKKTDDCLHFSLREAPNEVLLDLTTDETINSEIVVKRLVGSFWWKFPSRQVRCDEIFGACVGYQSEKRQKESIDDANRRLREFVDRTKGMGIEIKGKEKRFDYSLVYGFGVVGNNHPATGQ